MTGATIAIGWALAPKSIAPSVSLPITSDFYDIDNASKEINGFAPSFLAAADTVQDAKEYVSQYAHEKCDVLDLQHHFITGDKFAFSPIGQGNQNINNIFAVFSKIDLSYTTWQWLHSDDNTQSFSGCYTFGSDDSGSIVNLSTIKELNLAHAKSSESYPWNDVGDVYTAFHTFANCNLSNLIKLDLTATNFSSNGTPSVNNVFTGSFTFEGANLSSLQSFGLNTTVFASQEEMTSNGEVCTGYYTFNKCQFTKLTKLDLAQAVFSRNHGTLTSGDVYTGFHTFDLANFPELVNLDMTKTIFANTSSNNFNTNIHTASYTFYSAMLPKLTGLNFSKFTTFAVSNMANQSLYIADYTFANATLGLTSLDLSSVTFAVAHMTISTNFYTGFNSFYGCTFNNLSELKLGAIQLGNDGTGINTVSQSFLDNLASNRGWSTTSPLHITGTWPRDQWALSFDAWFSSNCWIYN